MATPNDSVLPAFDDAVRRAMARWPDVPRCCGWLELDRRGVWHIKGEPIRHIRTIEFLCRHYRADESGAWYVQNGPQKAYVTLTYTPWIYRHHRQRFTTHTGLDCAQINAAYLDDEGNLLLETEFGIGVVDDRDLAACAVSMLPAESELPHTFTCNDQTLPLLRVRRADAAARFGYIAQVFA